jgi:hypothetical protein
VTVEALAKIGAASLCALFLRSGCQAAFSANAIPSCRSPPEFFSLSRRPSETAGGGLRGLCGDSPPWLPFADGEMSQGLW